MPTAVRPGGVRLQADEFRAGAAYRERAMRTRLPDLSPRAVDAALAAAVSAAMVFTIAISDEPESRSPGVLAYVVGVGLGPLLLLRRKWPLGILVGSIGLLCVYYGLDYPAFSAAVPLAVAAYSAAVAGRALPATGVLAAFVGGGGIVARLDEGDSLAHVLRESLIADAALLAAVLLLGEATRNRRAWAEEVRARLRRAEQDREREADRRVAEERLRIARDMHDVLAHTVAAINVQAGVAADAIDTAPDRARAALATIRRQSRDAIAELKATVGVLREAPRAPVPGLAELDGLVDSAAAAGVRVEVSLAGAARPLPATVDLAAYRIVQESLTNVVRHAGASTASVRVGFEPEALVLDVHDDGRGGVNGTASGHGLVGMRERAAAVGGTLQAGAEPGGGFRVHARLPAPDA